MTNQLTHHAALAHNEDLLRQAAAARRAATLHQRRSLRALAGECENSNAPAARLGSTGGRQLIAETARILRSLTLRREAPPSPWPAATQRFGSSHRLPNGNWVHGAR
jgi:hypothetical protein